MFIISESIKGQPAGSTVRLCFCRSFSGFETNQLAISLQCLFLVPCEESRNTHFPTSPPLKTPPVAVHAFCRSLIQNRTSSSFEAKAAMLRLQRMVGGLSVQRRQDSVGIFSQVQVSVMARLIFFKNKKEAKQTL